MQVIPAVDILDGRVVRLLRGSYDAATTYGSDPVSVATGWLEEGAALVHVVDLNGARSGIPDVRLWEEMSDAGVKFQVGGGIRDAATARIALEAGATAVVMGTAAVWDPPVLGAIAAPEQVIAALDVRGGFASGNGWIGPGKPLDEVVSSLEALGITRALLTSIEHDGTMTGPDLDLITRVRNEATCLRVVASGGVSDLWDLKGLSLAGCEAVVVGRALYEKRFTLAEAIGAAV